MVQLVDFFLMGDRNNFTLSQSITNDGTDLFRYEYSSVNTIMV